MGEFMNSKVYSDAKSALNGIKDGMTICVGGFGICGIPENTLTAIKELGVKNLTCVSNTAGLQDGGVGLLMQNKQIKKLIASYVGENDLCEKLFLNKEIEIEFTPQGTLAEKLRSGGAGIPAFFTPTGAGTIVAEGKEVKKIDGRDCILEKSIRGDFGLVKAWKGDKFGNLVYRKAAQNFNPVVAMSGIITVAEVEELVEVGELDPDHIHTPGVYVQRIFQQAKGTQKRIERRTTREKNK